MRHLDEMVLKKDDEESPQYRDENPPAWFVAIIIITAVFLARGCTEKKIDRMILNNVSVEEASR